jgi:hypothetical protein
MEIIIHRVNTIQELDELPEVYGAEIDIRAFGEELILNHEPFQIGDRLEDYLEKYHHGTLILNIKEAGIEDSVLEMVRCNPQIASYFLLDVEFPYLYRSSREGNKSIAVRFSEDESLETVKKYSHLVDWVWIDTNTKLPIDAESMETLSKFKSCLVCPERWGRPQDIDAYRKMIFDMDVELDAVMTSKECAKLWL